MRDDIRLVTGNAATAGAERDGGSWQVGATGERECGRDVEEIGSIEPYEACLAANPQSTIRIRSDFVSCDDCSCSWNAVVANVLPIMTRHPSRVVAPEPHRAMG